MHKKILSEYLGDLGIDLEDSAKIDQKEVGCETVYWINLVQNAQESSGEFL
jgi:hypothetical protein